MRAAVEISMYPLTGEYRPPIQAFIDRLNTHAGLIVRTNALATQIWGDLDRIMSILTQEMTRSAGGATQLVFVMKVLPGLGAAGFDTAVIEDLSVQFVSAWHDTSWIEIIAAALAVAYLLLAIGQRLSCWAAAFVSSCLYVWVFFGAHLYMESVLNGFYALMAVYGFWQWQHGRAGAALPVTRWSIKRHAVALLGTIALAAINAYILHRFTAAASPFMDSMVTWSSVFATYLVARKVYENWHWWLIIDAVTVYLSFTRRLYLTMILFALYLVLIGIGMREWRRDLPSAAAAAA